MVCIWDSPPAPSPVTLAVTVKTMENNHNCIDEKKLSNDIEQFGWTVLLIESTEYLPSFAYTVGLWKNYRHPEIISFGLTLKTLHLILNTAGELIKAGQLISTNQEYDDFFENVKSKFIGVDNRNVADYFGYAMEFYNNEEFKALQLVWTDRHNNFPWDQHFEQEFKFRQPLLDRNFNFKFYEERNLCIFTTRQRLDLNQPILQVIHDNEGEWQFLTGDQMSDDIRLVALEQMIIKDETLNELFNLELGNEAHREFVGGKWKRQRLESNGE
jgi:hypothetical protein